MSIYGGDPSYNTLSAADKRVNHVEHNVPVDYSENSTTEQIYVYRAREFVKEGDFASLFLLARIGKARSKEMKFLPSWVPDWPGSLEHLSRLTTQSRTQIQTPSTPR